MLRAREDRDTARLPAGGVHLSAAREALVNKGNRLFVSTDSDRVKIDSQCSESFYLLGWSVV
jgi:hypothetical protein